MKLSLVDVNRILDSGDTFFFLFLYQNALFNFEVERNFSSSVGTIASELSYLSLIFASTDKDSANFF